jgi:hypothetical protein
MKTYKDINVENYESILEEVIAEIKELLLNKEVQSIRYGSGKILETPEVSLDGSGSASVGIVTNIQFGEETKKFYINVAIEANSIRFVDETLREKIFEAVEILKQIKAVKNEIKVAEAKILREAREKLEAEQKAKEEARELEEKIKAKQKKVIDSLNEIKKKPASTDSDFYYALGWMTKYVGTVSADIPDYLEDWFIKRFGPEAQKRVIDTTRATSGGNSMKWNPSFSISFKKPENIPISIQTLMAKNKINNTAFVFDLVENYGFVFGKAQDVEEIKRHIPEDKLENFEKGLGEVDE